MLIKTGNDGFTHPTSSDITPQSVYHGRRDLMKLMAGGVAGAAMASWASREALAQAAATAVVAPGKLAALASVKSNLAGAMVMEKLTDYKDASTYNNYYEFGTDKSDPARNAGTLKTKPWTVVGTWVSDSLRQYFFISCLCNLARSDSIVCVTHHKLNESVKR